MTIYRPCHLPTPGCLDLNHIYRHLANEICIPIELMYMEQSNVNRYNSYTEHCSVGPTKLIETIPTTARMKISDDEDFG